MSPLVRYARCPDLTGGIERCRLSTAGGKSVVTHHRFDFLLVLVRLLGDPVHLVKDFVGELLARHVVIHELL